MPMFHDLITPVQDTCEVVAEYSTDYYKGTAAITKNQYGSGEAWYFGAAFNADTVKELLKELPVSSVLKDIVEAPATCEAAIRRGDGKAYLFLLNYEEKAAELVFKKPVKDRLTGEIRSGKCELGAYDVLVLEV